MYASALVGFSCPTQEYSRSPRTLTSGDNCDMPLFAHFDASDYPFFFVSMATVFGILVRRYWKRQNPWPDFPRT